MKRGFVQGALRLGQISVITAALVATVHPASASPSQSKVDAVMGKARATVFSRLVEALEKSPSNVEIPWNNGDVSGTIIVYPSMGNTGSPMRSFKYTARDSEAEIIISGVRCRDQSGFWDACKGSAPDVSLAQDISNPLVQPLQENLSRLHYFAGQESGTMSPEFRQALVEFQSDEGITADGVANRQVLTASQSALERMGRRGNCESPPDAAGEALVCGKIR